MSYLLLDRVAAERLLRAPCPAQAGALTAKLQARLSRSPYRSLRRLECTVASDTAVLSGRVPSFYERQLALSLIMDDLPADMGVVDRIQVVSS